MFCGSATAMVMLTGKWRRAGFELSNFWKLWKRKTDRREEVRNNAQSDEETSNRGANSN
jgi:hypothetical protein